MRNRLMPAAFACLLAICGTAGAKTVALWPLDSARCAIDPRNDLTVNKVSFEAQTIGWNLPPNADSNVTDSARYLFDPVSRSCLRSAGNDQYFYCASSAVLEKALDPTAGSDFTVEGYFKWSALSDEGGGQAKILCVAFGGAGNPNGGWTLNCYNKYTPSGAAAEKTAAYFRLEGNGWNGDFNDLTEAETVSLTNAWNHFAIVFRHDGEANSATSDWTLYLNGVNKGTVNKRFSAFGRGTWRALLFARHQSANDNRTGQGWYDYWRVSDTALSPSEFLNDDPEGKGGAIVAEPAAKAGSTVAYWKLGCSGGKIDVRDYVGQANLAPLHGSNRGATPASSILTADEDCAFEGNPPNPTVVLPSGNHGSFRAVPTRLGYVVVTNNAIGAMLDVTNSFTVEGWFKPQRRAGEEISSQGWMFGIYPNTSTRGWMIGMERPSNSSRRVLRLHAVNYNGSKIYLHSTASVAHYTFCDVTDWGEEWRHVALTYDKTGGEAGLGEWKLYMDGVLAGTVTNNTAVTEATKTSSNFYIGGNINGAFGGLYDCVRVSQGVLSPRQFMCYGGEDAQAATGVIATWPLNVKDGSGLGGANVEGGYNLFGRETDFPEEYYLTRGSETAPSATVPNPDASPAFDGSSETAAAIEGSVAFCAGSNKDMGWLATSDAAVIDAFKSEDGWTLEGFVRYDTTNGDIMWSGFGTLFALGTALDQNKLECQMCCFRKTGYTERVLYLQKDAFGTLPDGIATVTLPKQTWHHFAACHSYWTDGSGETAVKMSRMAYYLDGVLATNVDAVAKTVPNFTWLIFGSNCNGSRGFPGMVSNFRLSRGVLDPSEFLNASASTPEAPAVEKGVLAYWPIDAASDDGVVDAEVRDGTGGYALWNQSQDAVTGSVLRARGSVPNDGVSFDRANTGSAALSDGGYAMADYLGEKLDVDSPWTVEGWFLRGSGTTARRVLAGSRDSTGNWGWRLYVDDTGEAPVFRLRVTPYMCTPMVEGAFPNASGVNVDWTDWMHVALKFDPFDGKGTWTLVVNGREYGKLENAWRNMTKKCQANFFGLGALSGAYEASFAGNVDMWRASRGALDAKDLLYRPQSMTMIIFR